MIDIKVLRTIYESLSIHEIYKNTHIHHVNKKNITLDSGKFCPQSSIDYAQRCNKVSSFVLKDMSFHFYYVNRLDIPISKILLSIKQAIVCKLYFNIKKSLNIHVTLSPSKRKFPQKNSIITPENINGGFTINEDNNIYIVRREEYSKVMLHEILHHCDKIHNTFTNDQESTLKNVFNISDNTVLVPNEAIVELWALLFTSAFLSFEYKQKFTDLVKLETQFSIAQSNKILKKQKNMKWHEETNAYCYIIFKTILLINLKEFTVHYTFPYDTEYVTSFLIKHKDTIPSGPLCHEDTISVHGPSSLRMTMLSD